MATFTQRGDKIRVQVRVKGASLSKTFSRMSDAKAWAKQQEVQAEQDASFPGTRGRRILFMDAVERYKREILVLKAALTQQSCPAKIRFWVERLGDKVIADITPEDIEAGLIELRQRGFKNATCAAYKITVSGILSACMKQWRLIPVNPCGRVHVPQSEPGRVRFLEDWEREALISALKQSESKIIYPYITLLLLTGMRRRELLAVTWGDVDLDAGRIILERTKNKSRRAVALCGMAVSILKEWRLASGGVDPAGLVFPAGPNYNPHLAFQNACKRAGIKNFRIHDLRHDVASQLAMSGASTLVIAEALGHKNLEMAKRYGHLSPDSMRELLDRVHEKNFRNIDIGLVQKK